MSKPQSAGESKQRSSSPEEDAKAYELYLEDRKLLIAAQRETAASFDKTLLTLASGAFAGSLVILKDLVPKPFANTLWLLGWSWGLFTLSLVTILIGFMAS